MAQERIRRHVSIPRRLTSVCSLAFACYTVGAAIGQTTSPARMPPPEKIFLSGNVYTLNDDRPRAQAIGVAGGRIVAVGSDAEVRRLATPETREFDLRGRTVLPGLIDAHGHMEGLGLFGLGRIDLSAAKNFDDVVGAVVERARTAKPGEWIIGGRWDHESWPEKRLPTHDALSAATPRNPVWLSRVDGHAGIANAEAMRIAGVSRATTDPPGGEVLRDREGNPTGVFVDNAEELIVRHITGASQGVEAALLKAQEMCIAAGLTGVHDAGVSPRDIEVYRSLADSGRLKLRVYVMVRGQDAIAYFKENRPTSGERLTVRAAKLYMDGAMGSRGAWLHEPYADRPTDAAGKPYTGLTVMRTEYIRMVAEEGLRGGYQVCTHAIGDRGNHEVLDAYGLALSRHPAKNHRFRIEHAQLLAPADIPRFAELGVIPSMQPTHCTSDMRWVEARVGERRSRGAYAWATLLRTGARVAAGSDFPVESHSPFLGMYAAVTRQDPSGEPAGGWHASERLTREEALRAFTLDAAYAAFEEDRKGSLEVGKLADFVVIDRDVMTCAPREIIETRVLQTVIGGQVVYSGEARPSGVSSGNSDSR